MKHASAVLIALFLGSMTLLAQSSGRDTQPAVAHVAQASNNCPIDMQAQRQIGQGTLASAKDPYNGIAQSLHLTLSNPKFREITGAQITVRGLNSKGRVSPAQTAQAESAEIKKTFDLKLKISGKSDASIDLLLPAFTSVSSIELDSVSYAGASTWHSSARHTCQVFPDAKMLISSR